MSLQFESAHAKGYRPRTGQLYLMKTTVGFIPVGVTSTEAFFGACVMLHPYKALVHDPSDTSYYPLVENNELLIPPVMIPKQDFRKGGCFTKNTDKHAPTPVPYDRYFNYVGGQAWNPEELGYAPTLGPYPQDRLPDFVPVNERRIEYWILDSNPPRGDFCSKVPEGTHFMVGEGIMAPTQLEFAIEDTLSYYGLIDTPRPPHADLSDDEPTHEEATTTVTPEEFLHLADLEGTTSLFAAMDHTPDTITAAITSTGHEPNGYFLQSLTTYLMNQHGLDQHGVDTDSEAGMFSILGNPHTLTTLHGLLLELLHDPAQLTATIQEAEAAGFDLND